MNQENLKNKISSILSHYQVHPIKPVLFTLFAYQNRYQIERDLDICNRVLLGKKLNSYDERFLNFPIPDSSIEVEPEENNNISISIDYVIEDGYVNIPIWLFKSLLEMINSFKILDADLFHHNNIISEFGNYWNGKREGEWIQYFASGKIHQKSYYRNGNPIGIWEEYFKNGQLKNQQNFDFKDYRNRIKKEWNKNGHLTKNWSTIVIDQNHFQTTLFNNGIIKNSWYLSPNQEIIEVLTFDELNEIETKRYLNLKGSLADGEHQYFDEKGLLIKTVTYKDGEQINQ